jgi:hypothetical protein
MTVEFEELKIKVPKPIMDFLRAYWQFVGYTDQTAEQWLAERLGEQEAGVIIADTVFNAITDDAEAIIDKYGLEPYRNLLGVRRQ